MDTRIDRYGHKPAEKYYYIKLHARIKIKPIKNFFLDTPTPYRSMLHAIIR